MSIDDLARAAATAARSRAATVDPELMLDRLHRTRRGRQVASGLAAGVVCAVVLVGVLAVTRQPPTVPASPPPASSSPTADSPCNNVTITCVGADTFRIALVIPVTVKMPDNFADIVRFNDGAFESHRNDVDSAGVTLLENARAVRNGASWSPDPSAGQTAASMATWLSNRPFLTGARVTRTVLDGRPAWRVSGELKPGAPLLAVKLTESHVAPTFTDSRGTTMGYNRTLTGDYTLLDVPGAGVTVIWSWTLDQPRAQLADNQAYVDGLSIG